MKSYKWKMTGKFAGYIYKSTEGNTSIIHNSYYKVDDRIAHDNPYCIFYKTKRYQKLTDGISEINAISILMKHKITRFFYSQKY